MCLMTCECGHVFGAAVCCVRSVGLCVVGACVCGSVPGFCVPRVRMGWFSYTPACCGDDSAWL